MIKIVIVGAAGRMGRLLISDILNDNELSLHAALEIDGHPSINEDAGHIAGCALSGIAITSNIDTALDGADAIIDFSFAQSAIINAEKAIKKGVSVILGTTGLDSEQKMKLEELSKVGRIVFAPNMSIGVNVLFYLCEKAGDLLKEYDIEIVETHHRYKKDAPSGTALGLAEAVCKFSGHEMESDLTHGREGIVGERTKKEIGMHAVRGGDVIGDHTVMFMNDGERVELTHKASSRQAFTSGALKAAKYLSNKSNGLYNMRDVLGLN